MHRIFTSELGFLAVGKRNVKLAASNRIFIKKQIAFALFPVDEKSNIQKTVTKYCTTLVLWRGRCQV